MKLYLLLLILLNQQNFTKQNPERKLIFTPEIKLSFTMSLLKQNCGNTPMTGTSISRLITPMFSFRNRQLTPNQKQLDVIKALLGQKQVNQSLTQFVKKCKPVGRNKFRLSLTQHIIM